MNEKKLTRSDFLFVYMMIFSLAFFVAGFYLGGAIIKKHYEKEITTLAEIYNKGNVKVQYQQTDFVHFYYNVLEPINEFKIAHLNFTQAINQNNRDFDFFASSAEMRDLTTQTIRKIYDAEINESAPLLIHSRMNFIHSLELYNDGLSNIFKEEEMKKEDLPILFIESDEMFQFNENWLLAQKEFYQAIYEWEILHGEKEFSHNITEGMDIFNLSLEEWDTYTLHEKNFMLSALLLQKNWFPPFQPEDITIHIDALVKSNGVEQFGLKNVGQTIELLNASNSIEEGDFIKDRSIYYPNLQSPLIPLFILS